MIKPQIINKRDVRNLADKRFKTAQFAIKGWKLTKRRYRQL
ncbi:hypothetical protein [Aeribacillus pallidus]|jgi:hypothetical protein|nr:hypothetical protein [Aeribacillus pallidus]